MVYHPLDVEGVISCWPAGHGTAAAPDDGPGALSGTAVTAETNPDRRERGEHRASSPRRRPDPAEPSSPSTTEPHPHVVTLNARQHPSWARQLTCHLFLQHTLRFSDIATAYR